MSEAAVEVDTSRRLARFLTALLNAVVVVAGSSVMAQETDARGATRPPVASASDRERSVLEGVEEIERRFNERERVLVERNQRLEHRIAELERLIGGALSSQHVSLQDPSRPDATNELAAMPSEAAQKSQTRDVETVSFRPYGFLVANAAYNTYALVPGNIAFFANPTLTGVTARQFSLSAGNTLLGTDILLPTVGDWTLKRRSI
jgi:hypothetical protein